MESLFLPTLCPPHHFTDFLNNLLDAEANMPWFFFFFYLIPLQAEEGQDWMRRSSRRVSWERNPTSIHENMGSIPGLAQWVKDLALLWLWYRPAAVAPIPPLAWELPYAAAVALKIFLKNFN